MNVILLETSGCTFSNWIITAYQITDLILYMYWYCSEVIPDAVSPLGRMYSLLRAGRSFVVVKKLFLKEIWTDFVSYFNFVLCSHLCLQSYFVAILPPENMMVWCNTYKDFFGNSSHGHVFLPRSDVSFTSTVRLLYTTLCKLIRIILGYRL